MVFLNLAPMRFRDILRPSGPVEKIDLIQYVNTQEQKVFEAHVFLKKSLRADTDSTGIYGACDGSGTGPTKIMAIRKGISEAIERWAFYSLIKENSKHYGLDKDLTSTGFAALPSFPKKAVRSFALREASERWAVTNWWNGKLSTEKIETHATFDAWEILTPLKGVKVCIVSQLVSGALKNDFYVYGFAADSSQNQSVYKALVELDRNRRALLIAGHGDLSSIVPQSISDQRLLFFARDEGRKLFLERINYQLQNNHTLKVPSLIADTEIKGPWSQYCTVWRCLYENTDTNLKDVEFFLF